MDSPIRRFDLRNSFDVVQARQCAREMARDLGFGLTDQTRVATAVSEIAQRALDQHREGSIRFAVVKSRSRYGLEFTFLRGGKAPDAPALAERSIPGGVERLMDEWAIEEGKDEVAIVMRKWQR